MVDDVVLDGVHDDGEEQHDEGDLDCGVSLCPAQGPVTDFDDEREYLDQEEDADFHAKEADEVYH